MNLCVKIDCVDVDFVLLKECHANTVSWTANIHSPSVKVKSSREESEEPEQPRGWRSAQLPCL